MLRIQFYKTQWSGQKPVGSATLDGTAIEYTTDLAKAAVEDALLRDIDKDDGAALQVAFRRAPHVFDGAYLRAALEEV